MKKKKKSSRVTSHQEYDDKKIFKVKQTGNYVNNDNQDTTLSHTHTKSQINTKAQ